MATAPAAPATLTLDRSDGSATMDLYRAVLGPIHTDHYLRAFTRFDAAGQSGPSWNWAAALLTLNWMLFRRLWLAALAYVGIVAGALLLLFGIGRLLFQLSDTNLWTLAGLGIVLAIVVPGAYGNAWLYAACNKAMTKALAASATLEEACEMLRKRSHGRPQLIGLGIGNAVLLGAVAALVGSMPGGKVEQADRATASGLVAPAAAEPSSAPSRSSQGLVQPAPALQASAAVGAASAVVPTAIASQASAPASAPAAKASAAEVPTKPSKAELQAQALEAKKEKLEKAKEAKEAKAAKLAQEAKAAKEAKEAKEAKAKTAAKAPASAAPASTPSVSDQYLINVGLFADPNNARNAYAKLQDAGVPAQIKELKSSKGPQTRVRAGPFDSEAEAERAAEKIRGLRLDAVVIKP